LIIGSASEYGKFYDKPIKEDFILHPTSLYGLSKIFLYNAATYFLERGLPIVYVRQFNTIGVGQRDDFVFSSFSRSIVEIEKKLTPPVLHVGDLTQERDFLDVRDTCLAYDILMEKGVVGETYNVASGLYISIEVLLYAMVENSMLNLETLEIIQNKNLFSKEASLSKRLHADIEKLKKLNFQPKFSLKDSIIDSLEYWRAHVR
jgi:GDP-4-dehydro-6-deoxy-D-mannose reductase